MSTDEYHHDHEYEYEEIVAHLLAARGSTDDERVHQYLTRAIDGLLRREMSIDERSEPKAVGDDVADFELPGVGNDGIETFRLSEYTETGPVVLTFYPFDFSPICTSQLCAFRDAEFLTFTENVDVFGISVDSAYSHQRFRDEYSLSFPLLSDRLASVAEQFGVKHDVWENHPAVCQRALFAIDSTDTVRYRWCAADANEEPTRHDLEAAVEWVRS